MVHSGDLAYMDARSYIRISGRVKDVLIRGGENVPVWRSKIFLYKHPAVAAVAVVGYPMARLGERGCAFIVPKPGTRSTSRRCKPTSLMQDGQAVFGPNAWSWWRICRAPASGKIQKFQTQGGRSRRSATTNSAGGHGRNQTKSDPAQNQRL